MDEHDEDAEEEATPSPLTRGLVRGSSFRRGRIADEEEEKEEEDDATPLARLLL